jgi:hypothetical protein
MAQILRVICDTYLKIRPTSVMELSEQEKQLVQAESILEFISYLEVGDHYKIILQVPISGSDVWYILQSHLEIIQTDKNFLEQEHSHNLDFSISQISEIDPTNPDSEFVGADLADISAIAGYSGGVFVDGSSSEYESIDTSFGDVVVFSDVPGVAYTPISLGSAPTASAPVQTSIRNDAELKKLSSGKVLFDTPHQMKVGASERVSVRIAKTITQDFFEGLIHTQESEIENIRTSRFMAVSLKGDDFKVEALGNEEQIIEDNDFTQWDWKVVPLKSGNRKLWVSITIQVKAENEQARKTLPVLEKEIPVKINPMYSIGTFVGQHWQWLTASAIIPVVGLLFKK